MAEVLQQHCGLLAVIARLGWIQDSSAEDLEDGEDYAVCLVSLTDSSATLPGQTSFPGGVTDLADIALARSNVPRGSDPTALAVRVAAVRQTFERTGMLLAGRPPPDFARSELRQVLVREGPTAFPAFLDDWGINLRPYSLRPLVRFRVPESPSSEPTAGMTLHIFLEEVPDAREVSFASPGDCVEVQRVQWLQPSRALRMYASGALTLPMPHWYTLKLLQEQLPSVNDLGGALQTKLFKQLRRSYLTPAVHQRLPVKGSSDADAAESVWYTLQGDSEHPTHPGAAGAKHRVLMRLKENKRHLSALALERTPVGEWEGIGHSPLGQHSRL
mmetsp:Transcript_44372/g.80941  ORF Transcript_44372/g.80941 Transcript_44372/m.80941 type:complete len:330 (-) Transcript_44372:186-1175(-)